MIWAFLASIWIVLFFVALTLCKAAGDADRQMEEAMSSAAADDQREPACHDSASVDVVSR